jgi:hypothetical protein
MPALFLAEYAGLIFPGGGNAAFHCVGGSNNQKVRRPGLAAPIPVNTGQRGR